MFLTWWTAGYSGGCIATMVGLNYGLLGKQSKLEREMLRMFNGELGRSDGGFKPSDVRPHWPANQDSQNLSLPPQLGFKTKD